MVGDQRTEREHVQLFRMPLRQTVPIPLLYVSTYLIIDEMLLLHGQRLRFQQSGTTSSQHLLIDLVHLYGNKDVQGNAILGEFFFELLMFTSQMKKEIITILGLVLTTANMTLKHISMFGHLARPQVLEMCGDQMGEEIIFALPAFAAKSTFHKRFISSRKSARDKAKAVEFNLTVGWRFASREWSVGATAAIVDDGRAVVGIGQHATTASCKSSPTINYGDMINGIVHSNWRIHIRIFSRAGQVVVKGKII